jgi:hypothetical protein
MGSNGLNLNFLNKSHPYVQNPFSIKYQKKVDF